MINRGMDDQMLVCRFEPLVYKDEYEGAQPSQ